MKTSLRILILCLSLLCVKEHYGQYLTIYSFTAPKPLNWDSPHSLLSSMSVNLLKKNRSPHTKRAMGHFCIELSSDDDTILTGMTSNNWRGFFEAFFLNKRGMALVFDVFPGHLETEADLRPEIDYRAEKGSMAFVRYKLTDESYDYLKTYIDSFKHYGYDQHYNGLNKPLEGKGAGCAAFAMSFMELVNILSPDHVHQWAVQVAVPDRLIGNEQLHRQVSPFSVYFSYNWAKDNEPYTDLLMFEPQLVYNWVEIEYMNVQSTGKPVLYKNAKGIEFDMQDKSKPIQEFYFSHIHEE